MLLTDKVAIVTGAASERGLGKAIASIFAEHGAKIQILDIDAASAARASSSLPRLNGDHHLSRRCDVTDRSACDSAVASAIAEFGHVDILVNNAGITQPLTLMDIGSTDYEAVLDVNLRGTLYMTQAVIPHMVKRRTGSIINISSVSAQRGGGIFGGPHYAAAKAGVLGLTKATAREFARCGIRANAICPGFIATDITGGRLTPEQIEQIVAGIPLGRPGDAKDVAGCALFLASDLSSYVTGSEVDVNGGSLIH